MQSWNRSFKRAMSLLIVFVMVFLLLPQISKADAEEINGVSFSHEGGFYTEEFSLTLEAGNGEEIRYTTNGSEPTKNSKLYDGPVWISAPSLDNSPITAGVNVGLNNYMNAMVVKAASFGSDGEPTSKTTTNTYFIDEDIENKFQIPIISITIEPNDFIGSTGMYTDWGNKNLTPQAFIEYYSSNGDLGFKHSAEVKISGHGSRGDRKKSIRMNFAKGEYENDKEPLVFDLFDGVTQNYYSLEPVTSHAKITARTTDWADSGLRETLVADVAKPLRAETMKAIPMALFINGEFFSIYEVREQADNNFISQHYTGVNKDEVVALAFDWDTANPGYSSTEPLYRVSYDEGPKGEEQTYYASYQELYDAITESDLKIHANYEKVKTLMDVDNFIDYFIIYMFFDNDDWPGNNVKMWRTVNNIDGVYGHDTLWRFIIHDFDICMWSPYNDRMESYTTSKGGTDARQPDWAVKIFKCLLENEEFRNVLAARYATYAGTTLSNEVTSAILKDIVDFRYDDFEKELYRWNLNDRNIETWYNRHIIPIYSFLEARPSRVLDHIRNYYVKRNNLSLPSDYVNITFSNDASSGYLSVAGADIRPEVYGAEMASGWQAKYIKKLPIEITANLQEECEFDYFIIQKDNADPEIITDQTFSLVAEENVSNIAVQTVYKEVEEVIDISELQNLIERYAGLNNENFTEQSWIKFKEAMDNAEQVVDAPQSQQEVEEAIEALRKAAEGLIIEQPDKSALEYLIKSAEDKNERDYSEVSWSALEKAVNQAKIIFDKDDATVTEVRNIIAELENAITQLSVLIPDMKTLENLLTELEDLYKEDYSEDTWNNLAEAISQAKALIESNEATVTKVENMEALLQNSKNNLHVLMADKSALIKLISDSSSKNEEDYTSDSWIVFSNALSSAQKVQSDQSAKISTVSAAVKELESAAAALVLQTPDKTALSEMINRAEGFKEDDYIPSTWKEFEPVLKSAQQIFAAENATVTDVKTALANLKSAIENLLVIAPDQKNLEKSVADAEDLNKEDYTEASWTAFLHALENARTILNKENPTISETEAALQALEQAIKNLEPANIETDDTSETESDSESESAGETESDSESESESETESDSEFESESETESDSESESTGESDTEQTEDTKKTDDTQEPSDTSAETDPKQTTKNTNGKSNNVKKSTISKKIVKTGDDNLFIQFAILSILSVTVLTTLAHNKRKHNK